MWWTTTVEDIIRRYADDVAYVTGQPPAADLAAFIDQLTTATSCYSKAGIHGHEKLKTALSHLHEARRTDRKTRGEVLRRADDILYQTIWDMTDAYRVASGDPRRYA